MTQHTLWEFDNPLILYKGIAFRRPAVFRSFGKETVNLVDPSDWVILKHRGP